MSAKKKKTTSSSQPKRTAKRKTAIPAASVRASFEPVRMRLAVPPADEIEPTHEMIAGRAFEIWEGKLRLAQDSLRNWLEAEAQLRKELNGVGL